MSEKLTKEVATDKIIDFMRYEEVLQLKTPDQLWKYMHENIKYGWTNKKGEFREYNDSRQHKEYYLHSPQETVERKSGICGDQVLLEKAWFNHHNIENHIISFGFKDDNGKRIGGGHVFLVYIMDGKYYYFENNGAMAANKWVGNYYLQADGSMAKNTWIGKYHVNASGKWDQTK